MAVLALFIALFCAGLIVLGLLGDAIDAAEREPRTTEPPMWRHPMTRPGSRRS